MGITKFKPGKSYEFDGVGYPCLSRTEKTATFYDPVYKTEFRCKVTNIASKSAESVHPKYTMAYLVANKVKE